MKVETKLIIGILLFSIALTALVYSPGMPGIFLFDDKPNIVNNDALILEDYSLSSLISASLSSGSGPLQRPISMLSFALNIDLCGLTPSCLKITNLVIHIACGLVLFFVVRQILYRYRFQYNSSIDERGVLVVAAAVALAWLLHPVNLTSVLYVVQRMNSLAALFCLFGILLYMLGRQKLCHSDKGWPQIISAFLITVPAMLSKENGALLPAFLLIVEIFLFQFQCARRNDYLLLVATFSTVILLPAIMIIGFLFLQPEWLLERYEQREFTLNERLLTQARVLWLYIGLILLPTNQKLSLFHDYLPISHGLFEPVSTLISVIAIICLLSLIWILRKKAPLIALGLAFFLTGHLVESTIIPLEITFEHRNYLPMIGLLLPVFYYLYVRSVSYKTANVRRLGAALIILLFGIVTMLRASQWGNPLLLAEVEARTNPNSARVNNMAGSIYSRLIDFVPEEEREKYYNRAMKYFTRVHQVDQSDIGGFGSRLILAARYDNEQSKVLFEQLVDRLRLKKLTATDVGVIKALLECVEKDVCSSEIIDIKDLATAMDDNANAEGKYAAIIYGFLSEYYWNNFQDKNQALRYSEKAMRLYPESSLIKLNHVRAMAAMGNHDTAMELLKKIKRDDKFNKRSETIRKLEMKLNQSVNNE